MRKPTLLKLRDPFARHIYLCPHACNGYPCESVHIPYIKCNSTDDRKTWEMTVDIAIKYHRRVKIGPFCDRYSPAGPEGLMGGKRVIVAAAAGGFYGAGTPHALAEHVRSYLGAVFAIIGITPQFIVAEGVQRGAEQRRMALNNAYSAISALQPA
jgi:hypothetical protein